MTKTLASILIVVAIALLRGAPVFSNPRDLWIGVVSFRNPSQSFGPQGPTALDPSTVLEPVGALVGGKWWFDSRTDQTVTDALLDSVGKVPALWLPPGTELPSRWQAHLIGGRQVALRTVGPLDIVDESQDLFVASDLKLPRGARSTEDDFGAQGIAVAGEVQVHFFTDLDASRHAELLRPFSARMQAAERAEIQRKAAEISRHENVYLNDVDIKLLIGQLPSTPRHTNLAKTASLQGERVYVIEGAKTFKIRDVTAILFTGAGARRDRNGALHLLGTWSYLDINEWAHENRPLAVVERDGRSCWLIAHAQEGGQTYALTNPGQIAPLKFTSTCDIK